jgi:hypothetical protein
MIEVAGGILLALLALGLLRLFLKLLPLLAVLWLLGTIVAVLEDATWEGLALPGRAGSTSNLPTNLPTKKD